MTSDGFEAFWKSVQNIPNIKSSFIGPVLEQLMGQNVAVQILDEFLSINLGLCFLGFWEEAWKYIAQPSTVWGEAFFYAILGDRENCQGFEDFLLEGAFNPFLEYIFYDFNYEYAELISIARAKP